jgi:hypothetical protein
MYKDAKVEFDNVQGSICHRLMDELVVLDKPANACSSGQIKLVCTSIELGIPEFMELFFTSCSFKIYL